MKYNEIINHPHYEPKHHPRMSREMRAAQFAPFAALIGYDQVLNNVVKVSDLKNKRVIDMKDPDARNDVYEID